MNGLVLTFLIIFIFAFAIAITIIFAKKENKHFEENKKQGTAIIVGYNSQTTERHIAFSVKIKELENEEIYLLKGRYNVKTSKGTLDDRFPVFKIGDEVKVEYAEKKFLGINFPDIRLREEAYHDSGYHNN